MSPVFEDLFRAQRGATRAVLCCFHVATRLSQGEGTEERKAAWAGMGAVPVELIEKILVLGELETDVSLHHRLPLGRSVRWGAWNPWLEKYTGFTSCVWLYTRPHGSRTG